MKKTGFGFILIVFFTSITLYFSFFMDNLLGHDTIQNIDDRQSEQNHRFDVAITSNELLRQPRILSENSLHHLIGESADNVLETYGEPMRVDLSAYDYQWWIYPDVFEAGYLQIGVEDGKVVTVYCIGDNVPTAPFHLTATYSEIENVIPFPRQIPVTIQNNSYQFTLTDEEIKSRPLIYTDGVFIQLYFDLFTNTLSSIRYLDAATLVKHRPYSVVYRGELVESRPLTDSQWRRVEIGSALQIFQITNEIRKKHLLEELIWDDETSIVAYQHSEDMMKNSYFSHTSPSQGELKDRLKKQGIIYQLAGENIAAKYVDAISAVEGWLNSEGHRVNLLHEDFTHLGVGVYEKYYTQNFMTPW